ncbi:MAG: VOC family protein [Alphaproteobacteria bacterium]|nr:VOC family protein [Alphaproteobacteria bacterium]
MQPMINCITLPVDDLKTAVHFYRDGMAFADGEATDDHAVFNLSNGISIVLLTRKEFSTFTDAAQQMTAPKGASEFILSYFAGSQLEVDAHLARAQAAGGFIPAPAKTLPWGYAGNIVDPDGHVWEIMYNPLITAAEHAAEAEAVTPPTL